MMGYFSKGGNTYWPHKDGHFSISDEGGWLAGAFENEEAADLAHKLKHMEGWGLLQRLQNEANARGDCIITVADLRAAQDPMMRDRTPYTDKELKEEIERLTDFSPKRAATYQELIDRRKKDKSQQPKNCTASNNNHGE